MTVGYFQFSPIFGEKEKNLIKVEERLRQVRVGVKPSLFCLPELFSTGYSFLSREELKGLTEEIPGETSERLRRIAQEKDMAICAGLAERKGDEFYNSAILCLPNGEYFVYRKIHLFFREKELFSPGDEPFNVFPWSYRGEVILIGLLICFDYIFPEGARTLALKKAQIICHPSNLILPFAPKVTQARSIENRVYWVLANRIGQEKRGGRRLTFIGRSQIVAPDGKILARSKKEEDLVSVTIDTDLALAKKVTPTNDLFLDRRPELYFR